MLSLVAEYINIGTWVGNQRAREFLHSFTNLHRVIVRLGFRVFERALMDSIFVLGETERAVFVQHMMQAFGCSYVCLWSYLPHPSRCLLFLDGVYQEESSQLQASSSSGSLARMLFNAYCESVNYVDHGRLPGFAFKNNLPYLEMKLDAIPRLASSEVQLQFYKEAGIKTVVFMGCINGEMELGMTSEPQATLQMKIQNWFPIDFSRQTGNPTSSSSSLMSLSLSVNSVEQSPPNKTAPLPDEAILQSDALRRICNTQFPTIETENDALAKAILAVLTSSTSQQTAQNVALTISQEPASAFRSYDGPVGARLSSTRKRNMFKRAVLFYRNLTRELRVEGNQPTTAQLHHMISERRRREKLNESFQLLRSLLPPGSKKDKASVLSNTTELISSLQSQVEQLRQRNETLKAQLSMTNENEASSSTERVNVEITRVSPSTSEARLLDLRVSLRSGECSLLDLAIRVLGFVKQQRNVSLLSMQSNSRMVEPTSVHGLVLRLKVEGDAFDELGFQEAVRRVVDDLLH